MLKAIRIWLLKRKLRNIYYQYNAIADNYGCGRHLLATVNSQVYGLEIKWKQVFTTLAAIDPDCPKYRSLIK